MLVNIILFVINKCIAPLIEGYILLKICNALLEKKFKNRFIDLSIILESALAIEIITSFDISKSLIQQVLIIVSLLTIVNVNYKGSIFKKITSYVIFMLIIIISEAVTSILLITLTNKNLSEFMILPYYYAWAVIISKTIQLLFLRIIIDKLLKKDIEFKNSYKLYGALLSLCIHIMFFSIVELFYSEAHDNNYVEASTVVILYVALLFIICLMIIIFIRIIKETKREAERKQLLEQYELEHKYSRELNKILDNLRILKHDLKNHISCMWGLVETNNIEDFKVYLSNLTDELERFDEDKVAIDTFRNKE